MAAEGLLDFLGDDDVGVLFEMNWGTTHSN